MCPSRVKEGSERGWIIPIGGAEEKDHDPRILRRFVELCGGDAADIVVIPTASQLTTTGERYERLFAELAGLMKDPRRVQAMGAAAKRLARPGATRRAAEILEEIARKNTEEGLTRPPQSRNNTR